MAPPLTPGGLVALLEQLPWGEEGVPRSLAELLIPSRQRPRRIGGLPPGRLEFLLLAALAISGWSARIALVEALTAIQRLHPRSGSYQQAFRHLEEKGLWMTCVVQLCYRKMALVRLTERGADLLRQAGVPVVLSEWERIELAHRRKRQAGEMSKHTAAVCIFLYHARRRGYTTEACPTVDKNVPHWAQPDAAVERCGLRIYVEVQCRGGRPYRIAQKWRNQEQLQGFAAICTMAPVWAARLARQAQSCGVSRGVVTDLSTLINQDPPALWTHCWLSPYDPLQPVVRDEAEADWLVA